MAKAKAEPKKLTGLASEIAGSLNKKFKNSSIRVVSGLTRDNVSNVTQWIPSGCSMLDLAISNLPHGGFPCGRTTILYGPEQSGKSLLAMHAIASTQKLGGIGIYVDAEKSLHAGFCEAIGVNLEEIQIIDSNEVEPVFDMITKFIQDIREKDAHIPITVVIDSIASLVIEDGADFTTPGFNTKMSIAFSNGLPTLTNLVSEHNVCMIMTNQARYKMNITNKYESPWKQPCGQALPHYSSVIVFMQKGGKKKATINGLVRIIGRSTNAKIEKNRLGPPEVSVSFDTYFDRGVDDYGSWAPYVEPFKLCKKSGAYYSYEYVNKVTGEVMELKAQGWSDFCKNVLERYPDVAEEIWLKLYDKFKTTYNHDSRDLEVIHEDDDGTVEYEAPVQEED